MFGGSTNLSARGKVSAEFCWLENKKARIISVGAFCFEVERISRTILSSLIDLGLLWGCDPQASEPLSTVACVESRITSSGFILCREIFQSRFSSPALTPSITIFTARFPIASSGCLTVVIDGAAIEDNGTSSKPTTQQFSGTFTPA